jgi:pimeloyl-ACP methyl ester carboxylesterase
MVIENPDFPWEGAELAAARERVLGARGGVRRPVVFLSGYHSPSFPMRLLRSRLVALGALEGVYSRVISYPVAWSVEMAAAKAARVIRSDAKLQGGIDVVGHSMGGIVARELSRVESCNITRLFTLATPHRGALLAERVRPDKGAVQLRAGSQLLARLDDAFPRWKSGGGELCCYATLRDWMVGATRSSPLDEPLHWLDVHRRHVRMLSHYVIVTDERIILDLALRLVGARPMSGAGRMLPPRD